MGHGKYRKDGNFTDLFCTVKRTSFSIWICSALLISCGPTIEDSDVALARSHVLRPELYDPVNLGVGGIDDIDSIVSFLSKDSTVDARHVGFGGSQSTTYAHYIRLKELASDSLLEELINHENPVVRVYSYWAIIERDYPKKAALMQIAMNDSAKVSYMNGCISSLRTVVEIVEYKWNEIGNNEK